MTAGGVSAAKREYPLPTSRGDFDVTVSDSFFLSLACGFRSGRGDSITSSWGILRTVILAGLLTSMDLPDAILVRSLFRGLDTGDSLTSRGLAPGGGEPVRSITSLALKSIRGRIREALLSILGETFSEVLCNIVSQ